MVTSSLSSRDTSTLHMGDRGSPHCIVRIVLVHAYDTLKVTNRSEGIKPDSHCGVRLE